MLLALGLAGCARGETADCAQGPASAASRNAASLTTLVWSPFGRQEAGWAVYEPLIAHEIGTACPAASPGFAASLAHWQAAHGVAATGVVDAGGFGRFRSLWQSRRPFVAQSRAACPTAPMEASLAHVEAASSYGGKTILLQPQALAAYRRLVAAARADTPSIAANRQLLQIFSGYRSPDYDAARCAAQQNCQGVTRAQCSAHRTGLALDVYLGAAPGFQPDSSDDANRLYLSRSATYRWLVANARRFGFVNYPFEPWHWEWVGGGAS
ncbi:MAG TPA: D-alanyl-D-alanine carboxypeptidase family protein [Caulobacteraceae bacterium]